MNKRIHRRVAMAAALALMAAGIPAAAQTTQLALASPDARSEVAVGIQNGHLFYSVARDHRPLISPSLLGFEFRGAPPLRDSLRVVSASRSAADDTWTQPWGEVSRVRDHHNELRVSVEETRPPGRR